MKKRRPKHRGNLACRLIGWHDRLFRVVALSTDGMATSSFIEKCKSLFISEASMAVEKAQVSTKERTTDNEQVQTVG